MSKRTTTYTILIEYGNCGYTRVWIPFPDKNVRRAYRGTKKDNLKKWLDDPKIKIVSRISKRDMIKFGIPSRAIRASKRDRTRIFNEYINIDGNFFYIRVEKEKNFLKKEERFWRDIGYRTY